MEIKKNIGAIFVFFIFTLIGISCNKQEHINNFIAKESEEMKLEAENILKELGYNNFKIFTFFHKDLDQKIVSKSLSSYKAIGNGIRPFFSDIPETDYKLSISEDFDGYFEQRHKIVNYDLENTKNVISPEYLSLTIIFDDISDQNKNELQKLLNLHIANGNRGDIIYIISK